MQEPIPFNKPFIVGKELYYVSRSVLGGETCGDGPFSRRCQVMIADLLETSHVLLTTSCGSALHMAAILSELGPGDEVIMPSYCSAAAANAFQSVGARLVFAEIDPVTLNVDAGHVEHCVTDRTRAILAHHYFGMACDMGRLGELAQRNQIRLVEDVAAGFGARYDGRALGTIGDFGAYSFHETKDLTCGEGGAIVVKDPQDYERAEIIREKGTNRSQFFRGQIDKYTWVDVGSSYVPSDLLAAFLAAQLEHAEAILARKERLYRLYRDALTPLVDRGLIRFQSPGESAEPNHHGFVVILESRRVRDALIERLAERGISAVFHFTPLHESRMGRSLGYEAGMLPVTEAVSRRLVRLPFFYELSERQVRRVAGEIFEFFSVEASE